MKLKIFYDNTPYKFRGWEKVKEVVNAIVSGEKKAVGEISFIITSDNYLRSINKEFLNHDYFTDVITFDYSSGDIVNGEIYISEDTVRRNSLEYEDSFDNEILRVMFHGILHLVGYSDTTDDEKALMRSLEDKWMKRFFENDVTK